MNTKKYLLIILLTISTGLLMWPSRASANNIVVDSETLWSTIIQGSGTAGQPNSDDNIQIINGGRLIVDVPQTALGIAKATCKNLTIGNATSFGILQFDSSVPTGRTLTVGSAAGGILDWGGSVAGNAVIMSSVSSSKSTIEILGPNVFPDGTGLFQAGLGEVQYLQTGNQTVAALAYKDLTLSGSGVKTLSPGVIVNGQLTISQTATVTGSPVSYGSLASLNYAGGATQTTTDLEFPSGMSKLVQINNPFGVILNNSKTLSGQLSILAGALLYDGGNTLVLTGNVFNNGTVLPGSPPTFSPAGQIQLAGSSQTLSGNGHYGNLILSTSQNAPTTFRVDGRLTFAPTATLNLNLGVDAIANFLAYGSPLRHQPAGTYTGSGSAPVGATSPTPFTGLGQISIASDVTAAFSNLTPSPVQMPYGSTSFALSGQVSGALIPAGSPYNYGNIYPADGETVTVKLRDPGNTIDLLTVTTTTTGGNGSFSFPSITPPTLQIGQSYPILYSYAGGNNLAAALPPSPTPILQVVPKPITVTAQNGTKTYGDPDAGALPYTVSPPLLAGDGFSVSPVTYSGGPGIGAFPIVANAGLQVTNATGNVTAFYNITVNSGATFTIVKKTVTIVPQATAKIYNGAGSDPVIPFNFVTNGVTVFWPDSANFALTPTIADKLAGALSRASGIHVGNYAILQGSVAVTPPADAGNFTLVFTPGVQFSITRRDVTITPQNNQSKTYGTYPGLSSPGYPGIDSTTGITYLSDVDPTTFGDHYVGFLFRFPTNEAAGNYPIVRSNPANLSPAIPNYARYGVLVITNDAAGNGGANGTTNDYNYIFDTSKFFAITPKDLNISAVDTNVVYGFAIPAPFKYVGLASGNGFADVRPTPPPTFTTTPPAVAGSPVGSYTMTIVPAATADPNYNSIYAPNPQTSTLSITRKGLTITANNKSKVADGMPYSPFDVTYSGFFGTDNQNNALTGALGFSGTAVTATTPGSYVITPGGYNNPAANYTITFTPGVLTLTGPVATNTLTGPVVWDGTTPITVEINKGNGGVAGINSTLFHVNGDITINSGTKVYVTTLMDAVNAGPMPKFDPTRPYQWRIVEATGTVTGAGNISLVTVQNSQTAGLFANPTFGGTFNVSSDAKDVFVNYLPQPPAVTAVANPPVAPTGNLVVGATNDTTKVLGSVFASDLPVLYLQALPTNYVSGPVPSATPVWYNPTNKVVINLNVGNITKGAGQNVVGCQAYIAYDSSIFAAGVPNSTNAGAPQIAVLPGVSDWGNLIAFSQPTPVTGSNELDVVIGVKLSLTSGTAADGTVCQITLFPRRFATTPNSRVVFRAEPTDTGGTTLLQGVDGSTILPARVFTEQINILPDTTGPSLGSFTATEVQAHKGTPPAPAAVNVASTGMTVPGTVNMVVTAVDNGVGLISQPGVALTKSGSTTVNLTSTDPVPVPGVTGTFNYSWVVDANTSEGTWLATASATDKLGQTATTRTFNLFVTNNQIVGVIQLDPFANGFAGTNRNVTFVAGVAGGTGLQKFTNTLNLNFVSSNFVAGSFPDRQAYANEVNVPTQPVSGWLHFGDINNLNTFYGKFMQQSALGLYLQTLEFGGITNLPLLAATLNQPVTAVDFYVKGRLSTSTLNALNAYIANPNAQTGATLTLDILDDFTIIINGVNIYSPITFAGVPFLHNNVNNSPTPPPAGFTSWEAFYLSLGATATPLQTATLNRMLLFDAYFTSFAEGVLNPQTPYQLLTYAGGPDTTPANNTLKTNLLADLFTIEAFPTNIYTPSRYFGIVLRPITQTNLLAYQANPPPGTTPAAVNTLNRELLEDAFVFTPYPNYSPNYDSGPLSAQTKQAVVAYLAAPTDQTAISNFDAGMIGDLTTNVDGPLIYVSNRWAFCFGAFTPDMLAGLPPNPPPTGAALVHLNHQLYEVAFTTPLGKMLIVGSQYATFTLNGVPDGTTVISAKTAWSLQRTNAVTLVNRLGTANFVTSGVYPTVSGAYNTTAPNADFYLRGGDLTPTGQATGDNVINLIDYNILVGNQGAGKSQGDINGDGVGSVLDYNIMTPNYLKTGDPNF